MESGWISLHRKIKDNAIFTKPNYLSVWVYLLMHANHKDKKIIWNNKSFTVKRGSFIGSISSIAKNFKLSKSTVHMIVKYLESERMIERSSNRRFTYWTIVNYDKYQDVERKVEHKSNTSRTQVETTNNDNNENNENKRFRKPKVQEVEKYCKEKKYDIDPEAFYDFYESKGWMVGKNKMKSWKSAVRTWVSRQKQKEKKNSIGKVMSYNEQVRGKNYEDMEKFFLKRYPELTEKGFEKWFDIMENGWFRDHTKEQRTNFYKYLDNILKKNL